MSKAENVLVSRVWDHHRMHGRHHLPWRLTNDPYHILVSELMLQQTQVERVVPKYEAFLEQWPTVERLAAASLGDVLTAWQGLGYNRRAKYLHTCAQVVTQGYAGHFPQNKAELQTLPGVGPYTAAAIVAFAYNEPVTLIETNVRRVYLHHFFPEENDVPDSALLPIIERTVPAERVKDWYSALMDYGSHLKQIHPNANQRSKHYSKQPKFVGSDRQIRGAILRELSDRCRARRLTIVNALQDFPRDRIDEQLRKLEVEGLVRRVRGVFWLG